ncbi:hypothetical protein [Paenibacillus sp. NEAU-GSW1]|uniref:hypothetical protein n=1 Tax=Paenibacillus sp. NEAU-GSW1 TaxID=2682486 RepID=UPI0012E2F2F9|nr:hypothetical protein [Paenibacillus sp. NEAU-GSW1]MUT65343.1 hypothetical protein [Paenibacillus sp. NEAU-GSW1]
MNTWQGAWHIVRHEMNRDKYGVLITIGFCLYMVFVTMGIFDLDEEVPEGLTWILDLAYAIVFPSFAFVMNRTSLKAWREDSFTDKLAEWRTMPISLKQLTLGRLIQIIIILTPIVILFFGVQYAVMAEIRNSISIGAYILFAMFWYFYGVGVAVMYVYYELGHSGKAYFFFCYLFVVAITIVMVILKLANVSVVLGLLKELQAGHWWYTTAAFIYSLGAMLLGYSLIVKRLEKRSFVNRNWEANV